MEKDEFIEKVAELRYFQMSYEKSRLQSTKRRIAAIAKAVDKTVKEYQSIHGKPDYLGGERPANLPSLFK